MIKIPQCKKATKNKKPKQKKKKPNQQQKKKNIKDLLLSK